MDPSYQLHLMLLGELSMMDTVPITQTPTSLENVSVRGIWEDTVEGMDRAKEFPQV